MIMFALGLFIAVMIQETQSLFDPRVREVLEILSFASTVIVAALGLAVFLQLRYAKQSLKDAQVNLEVASDSLRVAKNDLQIRVEREAVILAAEQAEKFGREILPRMGESLTELVKAGIDIREWSLKDAKFDETSLEDLSGANDWLRSIRESGRIFRVIQALNEFESFSMYFATGAANELIVYPSLARVYCSYIKQVAPLLVSLRQKNSEIVSGPYQNIITLYERWSSRLKKEELDEQAKKIHDAGSGLHITAIPVIGSQQNQ